MQFPPGGGEGGNILKWGWNNMVSLLIPFTKLPQGPDQMNFIPWLTSIFLGWAEEKRGINPS